METIEDSLLAEYERRRTSVRVEFERQWMLLASANKREKIDLWVKYQRQLSALVDTLGWLRNTYWGADLDRADEQIRMFHMRGIAVPEHRKGLRTPWS